MKTLAPYHQTLSAALEAANDYLAATGAVLNDSAISEEFAYGGVPYGTSKEAHARLIAYKGKPTGKYAHVTVWRSEGGIYEVNAYVL